MARSGMAERGRDRSLSGHTARRLAAAALVAAAATTWLSGCWSWSAPVGEPATPYPVETSATPVGDDALELLAQRCGTTGAEPHGDVSFTGEARRPQVLQPNGMTIPLGLRVDLQSEHGEHRVDLELTSGYVTDGNGVVVGVVSGVATPPGGVTGTSPAVSAPIVVSVGACPSDGVGLGDALPDGDYELVLSGPVGPLDHVHDQQEYWLAEPVPLSVTDGVVESV